MLDRRPFWGLILWLNLCVVVWLVSVQEPLMPPQSEIIHQFAPPTEEDVGGNNIINNNNFTSPSSAKDSAHKLNQIHDSSRNFSYTTVDSVDSSVFTTINSSADQQLIDLHNFAYLMTQPSCDQHIQALILVHTAPHNAEKRTLIRQTWGGPALNGKSPLRLVFLLGAVDNRSLQLSIEQENARHADMVQGNFIDAYRNMTYKHVMALKWFHHHCNHAHFLLKVDDDVYVNTPQLLKHLREPLIAELKPSSNSSSSTTTTATTNITKSTEATTEVTLSSLLRQQHNLMSCLKTLDSKVKRSFRSKWRVSFSEYRERYYPPYCPGFAILYSADVVARLYEAAQRARYFWVDDVHITGIMAQRTNTTITALEPLVLFEDKLEWLLNGDGNLDDVEFLVSWHSISQHEIYALWKFYALHDYTLTSGSPLRPQLPIPPDPSFGPTDLKTTPATATRKTVQTN